MFPASHFYFGFYLFIIPNVVGNVVASWLALWTLDRTVQFKQGPGFLGNTLYSYSVSPSTHCGPLALVIVYLSARIAVLSPSRPMTFLQGIGRRGGQVVGALDSGAGGPGSSPGRGTALCSWARHFTLIVPLSTLMFKWVPGIYCCW